MKRGYSVYDFLVFCFCYLLKYRIWILFIKYECCGEDYKKCNSILYYFINMLVIFVCVKNII